MCSCFLKRVNDGKPGIQYFQVIVFVNCKRIFFLVQLILLPPYCNMGIFAMTLSNSIVWLLFHICSAKWYFFTVSIIFLLSVSACVVVCISSLGFVWTSLPLFQSIKLHSYMEFHKFLVFLINVYLLLVAKDCIVFGVLNNILISIICHFFQYELQWRIWWQCFTHIAMGIFIYLPWEYVWVSSSTSWEYLRMSIGMLSLKSLMQSILKEEINYRMDSGHGSIFMWK